MGASWKQIGGGVLLVDSDDPEALAQGINVAITKGPLSMRAWRFAVNLFTVEQPA